MEVIFISLYIRNFKYPLFYNKFCDPHVLGDYVLIFLFVKVKDMSERLSKKLSSNTNLLLQ